MKETLFSKHNYILKSQDKIQDNVSIGDLDVNVFSYLFYLFYVPFSMETNYKHFE